MNDDVKKMSKGELVMAMINSAFEFHGKLQSYSGITQGDREMGYGEKWVDKYNRVLTKQWEKEKEKLTEEFDKRK